MLWQIDKICLKREANCLFQFSDICSINPVLTWNVLNWHSFSMAQNSVCESQRLWACRIFFIINNLIEAFLIQFIRFSIHQVFADWWMSAFYIYWVLALWFDVPRTTKSCLLQLYVLNVHLHAHSLSSWSLTFPVTPHQLPPTNQSRKLLLSQYLVKWIGLCSAASVGSQILTQTVLTPQRACWTEKDRCSCKAHFQLTGKLSRAPCDSRVSFL